MSSSSHDAGITTGAAYTIKEECERLFCEDLRAIFLGETEEPADLLVIGAFDTRQHERHDGVKGVQVATPSNGAHGYNKSRNSIREYVEVWDYTGGARFRGFTSEESEEADKTLFVFFDEVVTGKDLKQALMALIELATTQNISCDRLVICVQREISKPETTAIIRDLGWVGFEPITLERWTGGVDVTSRKWVFLGMEVE